MSAKGRKNTLDVDYLKVATSHNLAASVFAMGVQEEEQRVIHEQLPQQIPIDLLFDNPYQPRTTMAEESLRQLSETIASQGFQGVLVARPHPQQPGAYQLTAGHRRREAARLAGLSSLPVIIHDWSEQEMAALAATENIQREDLSPLEEGRLFQLMIDQLGLTQMEVAEAVKKDRGYVRNRLRLARAPEDIQAFVREKSDSLRAVIYLLEIEDPQERAPIIEQLLKRTLTTEDLPAYIAELKQRSQVSLPQSVPEDHMTLSADHTPRQNQRASTASPQPGVPSSSAPALAAPDLAINEQKEQRIRTAKLRTSLRYLKDYRKMLNGQPALASERELLRQLVAVARSLLVEGQ
ncbi:MAG TPA: ParB/RepB/Spo0J family partition protein [Ktedonobacteraceae bacterium]|jgi:ParB family chromosome partitioning protein|nr:ParB/RepB/Spo0J family partition protein [Ktedonobacteraceae bacterium]